MNGLCENIVESGDLGTNECHVFHFRWNDLSVHVKPIFLLVKSFDCLSIEVVVVSNEACSLDNKIRFDLSSILENDTIFNTSFNFTKILRDLIGLNCISKIVIENLPTTENIDFNCTLWNLFPL